MAKKKHKSRKQGMMKKIARGLAYGVADAMILTPALVPVVTVAKEVAGGHSLTYALNTTTQNIAGVSLDGGDLTPDYGKIAKYAVGSGAMVILGLGFRHFIAKRV
jgi:hypothetical protein